MSSHRGSKAEATRVLILDAAAKLFFQFGVNEVSISRIMAEIGLTTGGFYKYFSSKEMLAAEVCYRTFREAQTSWEEQAARARQASENPYRGLVNQYLSFSEKSQCAVVAFSHDAADASHHQLFSQSYREGTKALLDTLLGVAQEPGSGSSTREQVLVHFAAMLGAGLLCRTTGAEQWVQEIQTALLDQLG
ncbi:hypothetical protein B1219_18660 [Pseudomonas ogarae]|uniref:TetR/AcrR family transcriptional regulator n=1 Tax=Pseudomonas ogarae (strain DSM 112162 / CECT 30235 / F113) TaxID=1114970 RepID=UPI0009A3EC53|nr:TetR/AcrR family transcriptional regulator [Pseudomonas ogarae]OPG72170.1 hypothetical protein B1219_18660 [Pseudomonas ogarae]